MAEEPKLPLKDHFMPNEYTNPTCIQMPIVTGQFEIKSSTISHVPNFYGKSNEDPYQHLNEFNDLCITFNVQHLTKNALKLRLFLSHPEFSNPSCEGISQANPYYVTN